MEKLENAMCVVWYTAGVPNVKFRERFPEMPELHDRLSLRLVRAYGLVKNFLFANLDKFQRTVNLASLTGDNLEVKDALGLLKTKGCNVAYDLVVKTTLDQVIRDLEGTQLGVMRGYLTSYGWDEKLLEYYKLYQNSVSDPIITLSKRSIDYKERMAKDTVTLPYSELLLDKAKDLSLIETVDELFHNVKADLPVAPIVIQSEPENFAPEYPVDDKDAVQVAGLDDKSASEEVKAATDEPKNVPAVSSEPASTPCAVEPKRTPAPASSEPAKITLPAVELRRTTQPENGKNGTTQQSLTTEERESVMSDIALNSEVIYVDCDNTNFFIFLAFLRHIEKIRTKRSVPLTIKMYADMRSHPFWSVVPRMFNSIKYKMELRSIEYIKSEKSVVDMAIAVAMTKDVVRGVKAATIMSSDSDYFGIIKELKEEDAVISVAYVADYTSGNYLRYLYNEKVPHCDMTSLLQEGSLQAEADRIIRSFTLTKFAAVPMNRWNRELMVRTIKQDLQFGQGTDYAAYFSEERVESAVDATLDSLQITMQDGKMMLQANGDRIELEVGMKGVC